MLYSQISPFHVYLNSQHTMFNAQQCNYNSIMSKRSSIIAQNICARLQAEESMPPRGESCRGRGGGRGRRAKPPAVRNNLMEKAKRFIDREGGSSRRKKAQVVETPASSSIVAVSPPPSVASVPTTAAPSAPSTILLDAASALSSVRLTCRKCQLPTRFATSYANGANPLHRICQECNSTKTAWREKCSKDTKLKVWFRSLTATEEANFYRMQAEKLRNSKRREWDLSMFEEYQRKEQGKERRQRTKWIPQWKWASRVRKLRPDISDADLESSWLKTIGDPTIGAIKEAGVWLVPSFEGVIEDSVDINMSGTRALQQKQVRTAEEMSSLIEAGAARSAEIQKHMAEETPVGTRTLKRFCSEPDIQDHEIMPARRSMAPPNIMEQSIERQLMKRTAVEDELEDQLVREATQKGKLLLIERQQQQQQQEGTTKGSSSSTSATSRTIELLRTKSAIARIHDNLLATHALLVDKQQSGAEHIDRVVCTDVSFTTDKSHAEKLKQVTMDAVAEFKNELDGFHATFVEETAADTHAQGKLSVWLDGAKEKDRLTVNGSTQCALHRFALVSLQLQCDAQPMIR